MRPRHCSTRGSSYIGVVARSYARVWFTATVVCVVAGVVISITTAVHNTGGHFHTGVERGFNTFAFFTIQSNVLVGITSAWLVVADRPSSSTFRVLRLTALVAIIVTGVVYHVAIARLLDLESWALVGDQLVHTVVPILAVAGWLLFGPRGLVAPRVVWLSLVFPVAWLTFTLIRGAVVNWYPYHFIDVTHLGYGKAVVNCVWVAILLLGLAAGSAALDTRLDRAAVPAAGSGRPG